MKIKLQSALIKKTAPFLLLPLIVWLLATTRGDEPELKLIDPSHTCMGSNQAQTEAQDFAEVEGKRYYGCSKMCIVNLKENQSFRYGIDPVSGEEVDKASALVASRPGGDLLYFASEKTFRAYRK
jgi:YHS domain-containing protein